MFISHIHEFVKKHSRLAFIFIGLAMIFPFVFLWNDPSSLRSRFGGNNAGTIYGKSVAYGELHAQQQAVNLSYFLSSGRWLDENTMPKAFQAMVDQEAWHRLRVLHVAKQQNMDAVSPSEIAATIQAIFSKDKVFDQELFNTVMTQQFNPRGIDGRALDAIIRDNIVVSRLEQLAVMGLPVSPVETKQLFQMENRTCEADLLLLSRTPFLTDPAAKPTPAQVAAFYKDKIEPYRAVLTGGKTPSDLVREKTQALRDAAVPGTEPEAAQLTQVERDIAQFATPFYRPQEKIVRIAIFPHAPAEAAAWKLVTDERVNSEYAQQKELQFHNKPENEAKDIIREKLLNIEIAKLASKQAQTFGDAVYAAAEKEGLTGDAAVKLFTAQATAKGIRVELSTWFNSGSPLPGHTDEFALTNAAANLEARGDISDAIRGKTAHFITTLADVRPGYIPAADDAATQAKISEILTQENALRLAREKAATIYTTLQAKLQAGTLFAAASAGLDFKRQPTFSRREPGESAHAATLSKAILEATPNLLLPPTDTEDGALLLYINSVTAPHEKELAAQQDALKSNLAQGRQMAAARAFRERLEKESKTTLETGKP